VSEDAYVKLWKIPDGGPTATITEATQTLQGHKRKVGTCDFHPTANNVLATSSGDLEVKIWDVEGGKALETIKGHTDIIQCVAWNSNGSHMATTCKDKKIRIADPRTDKTMQEYDGHSGVKGSRILYLGAGNRLLSVGFSKLSERQFMMWDSRNMSAPLVTENIDTAAGLIMPFYDADLNILYLGGKGDGNIRLYEVTDEEKGIYYLTQYGSNVPQRGLTLAPKRCVDVGECEIDRIYKIHGDGKLVEPLHFQVPRKSDMFQDDLYPAAFNGEAALSSSAWWGGANKNQPTTSLEHGFVAKPSTD